MVKCAVFWHNFELEVHERNYSPTSWKDFQVTFRATHYYSAPVRRKQSISTQILLFSIRQYFQLLLVMRKFYWIFNLPQITNTERCSLFSFFPTNSKVRAWLLIWHYLWYLLLYTHHTPHPSIKIYRNIRCNKILL